MDVVRSQANRKSNPAVEFSFANVTIDFIRRDLKKAGKPVKLGGKEWQLLRYLVTRPEQVVSRKELLENVWNYKTGVESRTLDMHIAWLRRKLEDFPRIPRHIHTVRGQGFRFTCWSGSPAPASLQRSQEVK